MSSGESDNPTPINYIVIEMTPVQSVDSTAVHMLEDMHRDLKERGIRLCFSTVNSRVEGTMMRAGLIEKMGAHWIHPAVHSAVQHCIRHRMSVERSDGDVTLATPKPSPRLKKSDGVASPNAVVVSLGPAVLDVEVAPVSSTSVEMSVP